MHVSIFGVFDWKTTIHSPKIGILRQFDPHKLAAISTKAKKAHPCLSPRHLSHGQAELALAAGYRDGWFAGQEET